MKPSKNQILVLFEQPLLAEAVEKVG